MQVLDLGISPRPSVWLAFLFAKSFSTPPVPATSFVPMRHHIATIFYCLPCMFCANTYGYIRGTCGYIANTHIATSPSISCMSNYSFSVWRLPVCKHGSAFNKINFRLGVTSRKLRPVWQYTSQMGGSYSSFTAVFWWDKHFILPLLTSKTVQTF